MMAAFVGEHRHRKRRERERKTHTHTHTQTHTQTHTHTRLSCYEQQGAEAIRRKLDSRQEKLHFSEENPHYRQEKLRSSAEIPHSRVSTAPCSSTAALPPPALAAWRGRKSRSHSDYILLQHEMITTAYSLSMV